MYRVTRLSQPVVRELQRARGLDQSHAAQIGEMSRYGGLWQAQDLDQVTDAQLAGDEQVEQPDSRRIGEALEQHIEIIDVDIGRGRVCGTRGGATGSNVTGVREQAGSYLRIRI